jgi:hypothetical protein
LSLITYFATPRSRIEIDILCEEGATCVLIPYNDTCFDLFYRYAVAKGMTVMVDSGAYNAFTQGKTINAIDYGRKMLELSPKQFMNLDVIGNAIETEHNQAYLEFLGLHPIPIWHHGNGYDALDELAAKYDYIAIGGLVTSSLTAQKKRELISTITGTYSSVRFHGLGVGRGEVEGLYSGDSTTWLTGARYGRLITKRGTVELRGSFFTKKELLRHNIRAMLSDPVDETTPMDCWNVQEGGNMGRKQVLERYTCDNCKYGDGNYNANICDKCTIEEKPTTKPAMWEPIVDLTKWSPTADRGGCHEKVVG